MVPSHCQALKVRPAQSGRPQELPTMLSNRQWGSLWGPQAPALDMGRRLGKYQPFFTATFKPRQTQWHRLRCFFLQTASQAEKFIITVADIAVIFRGDDYLIAEAGEWLAKRCTLTKKERKERYDRLKKSLIFGAFWRRSLLSASTRKWSFRSQRTAHIMRDIKRQIWYPWRKSSNYSTWKI